MRKVKFRIFSEELGKIYTVNALMLKELEEDGGLRVFPDKNIEEGEVKNYVIDGKTNILMQYIGKVDKHGVEIYEGDILASSEEGKRLGTVIFDEDKSAFQIAYGDETKFLSSDVSDIEVVGNIYETPEKATV